MKRAFFAAFTLISTLLLTAGVPVENTVVTVANLTALQNTSIGAAYSGVIQRVTDGTAGAPPLNFSAGSGTCASVGMVNDGASCVNENSGNHWVGIFPAHQFDVTQWGVTCGVSDSTTPLQNAANYATTVGGQLQLACPITISGQVTLHSNTRLTGEGSMFYQGMIDDLRSSPSFVATWPPTGGPAINCTGTGVGSCLLVTGEGIEIDHLNLGNPEPAPTTGTYVPTVYPYIISTQYLTNWNGLNLHDLTFTSFYDGIDLEGSPNYGTYGVAGSQWALNNIWFNATLDRGILFHNIDNTGRVSNIEYAGWWYSNNASLAAYEVQHSVGMDIRYLANTEFNNIEFFANSVAMLFTNSTVMGGFGSTFAALNLQLANIDFNLPCQAMKVATNTTTVTGVMSNVIAYADTTGRCNSQNAFFDLSSDNANFSISKVQGGSMDTIAAIGTSAGGVLRMDDVYISAYSAITASQPAFKVSSGAQLILGSTVRSNIFPAAGAGLLLGPGVDSTQGYEQGSCVGGGSNSKEGAACLFGSLSSSTSGTVTFFDKSNVNQGFIGNASTANGLSIKSNKAAITLQSTNGSASAMTSFGADSGSHNLINLNPLPTTAPSGTGLSSVCVDNAGNLYANNCMGVGTDVGAAGAVGDGVTDDSAAINAAAAASVGKKLIFSGKTYRAASTIVIPDNVDVEGVYSSNGGTVAGSVIKCDLSVTPCVKVGTADNGAGVFNGVSVTRAPGTIPSTAVGIQFNGTANEIFTNSTLFRHGISIQALATGPSGIYLFANHITTCEAVSYHLEVNSFPGVYFTDSTFGCNGAFDVASTAYVHIDGNWDSTKGTVHFSNVQFNQGQNTVGCAFAFDNFTGATNTFYDLEVTGGHAETLTHLFCSDASVAGLQLIQMNGLWSAGLGSALNLNAATALQFWNIIGNTFTNYTDFTAAPTPASGFSQFVWSNNIFQQPVHLTAPSGSTLTWTGNSHNGNVTLDGTGWGGGSFNDTWVAGSFTSPSASAMQNVAITLPPLSTSCTLLLGGAQVSMTFAQTVCQYELSNHILTFHFIITLTAKGSSTGAVTITGLPFATSANYQTMAAYSGANMVGLTGGQFALANSGSTKVLQLCQSASTQCGALLDSNLSNTSDVRGLVQYLVGSN